MAGRVVLVILIMSLTASAQPDNPPPPDDTPVPITGLEYLLISGGILGGYKLLKKRKENNQP